MLQNRNQHCEIRFTVSAKRVFCQGGKYDKD